MVGIRLSDVNKTTSLKTKTKVGKTYTKTNVVLIAGDNVIINGKVAIIVSFFTAQYSVCFTVFSS